MHNYTAHAAKRLTGLYRGFSCDLPHSTAADGRPSQADITPPAPRWSVSQRRNASSAYQIPPPRRTLYRTAQPPYYNNVYKVRPCYGSMPDSAAYHRPCKPGGVSSYRVWIRWQVLHLEHLLRGQRLHLYRVSPAACDLAPVSSQGAPTGILHPAGQSSSRGEAGGAEPLAATAATLFGLSPDSQ